MKPIAEAMEIYQQLAEGTSEAVQNELATSSTKSPEGTSIKTDLPTHWVSALFKRLQARYFHKWTSAIEGIEDLAVDEWAQELSGLTGEQIKHGLEQWSEDWPPSAPEFRQACEGNQSDWQHSGGAYREYRRDRLLSHEQDSAIAESELNKIREVLR